jgi:hypothetical protein
VAGGLAEAEAIIHRVRELLAAAPAAA